MQNYDVVQYEYLQNNERFADFMNAANFGGKQMIAPGELTTLDHRESSIEEVNSGGKDFAMQYRDLIKKTAFGTNFALLGVENQTKINYAMPVRCLNYDSMSYQAQLRKIKSEHRKQKDLRNAEFLSGFSKEDLLKPIVTWVLYWGTEPWDAATDLHGILDFADIPEELKDKISNYKLNILDVHNFDHLEYFKTDLRQVFGFIQNSRDKEKLAEYVKENKEVFSNLAEDAYDVLAVVTHTDKLNVRKEEIKVEGGKVDVCKAIDDMIADGEIKGEIKERMNSTTEHVRVIRKKQQKGLTVLEAVDALEKDETEISKVYALLAQNPDFNDRQIAKILVDEFEKKLQAENEETNDK